MELASAGAHLTYCTNIHPGERWQEVRANLERYTTAVKQQVAPERAFGVGLRLSALAARELAAGEALGELRDFLRARGLYVFTLNGFPYGTFHGQLVKERVYQPDWRDASRLAYTNQLAELLAALLPEGQLNGSVSTVPGAFKRDITTETDVHRMVEHLLAHVAYLHALRERTGRTIALALEPEPCCYLETIDETVRFFDERLLARVARDKLAASLGSADDPEAVLRRHLGVCLDSCHAAVEFEDAADCVARLRRYGIDIKKLQLSCGLRVDAVSDEHARALEPYLDGVYLHQVVERRGDTLRRFVDLPHALEALRAGESKGCEWRIHFHVPVFLDELPAFGNTQPFLRELLAMHAQHSLSEHLEVETYTWDVLPGDLRDVGVDTAIARELTWVQNRLAGAPRGL